MCIRIILVFGKLNHYVIQFILFQDNRETGKSKLEYLNEREEIIRLLSPPYLHLPTKCLN